MIFEELIAFVYKIFLHLLNPLLRVVLSAMTNKEVKPTVNKEHTKINPFVY